jgi:hypothetical protein
MSTGLTNIKKLSKDKSNGIIFSQTDGNYADKEIFYDRDRLYIAKKVIENGQEKIYAKEIIDIDSLSTKLNRRVLNYELFPFEAKDNWFRYQGVCHPAFIGYTYKLLTLKIAILETEALNGTNNSVLDELSRLSSAKVVKEVPNITNLFTKTFDDVGYPANTTIGLFFNGKTSSQKTIDLKMNGNNLLSITADNLGLVGADGGTPEGYLYISELIIEPYFGENIYQITNNQ